MDTKNKTTKRFRTLSYQTKKDAIRHIDMLKKVYLESISNIKISKGFDINAEEGYFISFDLITNNTKEPQK